MPKVTLYYNGGKDAFSINGVGLVLYPHGGKKHLDFDFTLCTK